MAVVSQRLQTGFSDERPSIDLNLSGLVKVNHDLAFEVFAETADHQFCEIDSGKCVGQAKTAMLWRLKDGKWQLTRIFSYDHQALEPSKN